MTKVDKVIDAVRTDLLQRSQLGIVKYGVTLCEGGYSHRDFLQHAYEEALDLANYLKGAIMKIDDNGVPGLTSQEVITTRTNMAKVELNAVIRILPVQDGDLARRLRGVLGLMQ